jgi:two-component system, cell cycle sensor histidine kinase and response regulator CckA
LARNSDSTQTVGCKLNQACIHILLVEDNLAEARFLQEVLKGAMWNRFQLQVVSRLRDALNQLHDQDTHQGFDLILLDLTLPDSQGLASLDLLIQQAPKLPIVVLTNTNDDELAVEAVRHGAQDYLFKRQVNQDTLVRALRYAIERKQAEEELRDANETLERRVQERTLALETSNQLLVQEIADRHHIQQRLELAQKAGKIGSFELEIPSHQVTWSAELIELYGRSAGSFGHTLEEWIATMYADDRIPTEKALWEALDKGQGLEIEFRILYPDGQIHWIAVKSSLFHDATGNPLRMIGIHMDITEKKQLEAQFLRAQRLESLGTLASGISHDLNNILTPILAVAQLLPIKLPNADEKMQRMFSILEDSAKRGSDLIKQILFFARGVEGKRVPLQVRHLLLEIEQIILQTLPKSIDLHTNLATDLWMVIGDVTQLHQVFMNLWVNARDAMPNGGHLTIAAENIWIDEAHARRQIDAHVGAYIQIRISDNGTGMPTYVLNQIFDPFFTTKELGKGSGLGLSAVLGIIKSHRGFVEVESQTGQGSQFSVYLPSIQDTETIVPPSSSLMLNGNQDCILVVDDESVIRETLQTTLETFNYQVLLAEYGEAAIAVYQQNQPKISGVLIDLMMPGMDGLTTIAHLRNLNPEVAIIAMSGLDKIEVVAQAKELGIQNFIQKPFSTQDILQTLQGISDDLGNAPPRINGQ